MQISLALSGKLRDRSRSNVGEGAHACEELASTNQEPPVVTCARLAGGQRPYHRLGTGSSPLPSPLYSCVVLAETEGRLRMIAALVQEGLGPLARAKYEHLITVLVHLRDVTREVCSRVV